MKIYQTGEVPDLPDAELDALMERITADAQECHLSEIAITHYWKYFEDHKKQVYFGTPETFAQWRRERLN